jgi:hypothetical protein
MLCRQQLSGGRGRRSGNDAVSRERYRSPRKERIARITTIAPISQMILFMQEPPDLWTAEQRLRLTDVPRPRRGRDTRLPEPQRPVWAVGWTFR